MDFVINGMADKWKVVVDSRARSPHCAAIFYIAFAEGGHWWQILEELTDLLRTDFGHGLRLAANVPTHKIRQHLFSGRVIAPVDASLRKIPVRQPHDVQKRGAWGTRSNENCLNDA